MKSSCPAPLPCLCRKLTPAEPSVDQLESALTLALEGTISVDAELLTPAVVEAALVHIRARTPVLGKELWEAREGREAFVARWKGQQSCKY